VVASAAFAPRRKSNNSAALKTAGRGSGSMKTRLAPKPKVALYGIFRLPVIWRNHPLAAPPSELLLVLLFLLCGGPRRGASSRKRERFFATIGISGILRKARFYGAESTCSLKGRSDDWLTSGFFLRFLNN
jgi:hypothetical protein